MTHEGSAPIVLIFVIGLSVFPGVVAMVRHHHQRGAIAVLNLLLGWTGLGWAIALIWACTAIHLPQAAKG